MLYQLCYEATDVGSRSIVGLYVPVNCFFTQLHKLRSLRRSFRHFISFPQLWSFQAPPPRGEGLMFAWHLLLVSQSPYPIIVYSVANYRPHLSHLYATPSSGSSPLESTLQSFPTFSNWYHLVETKQKTFSKILGVQKIIMLFCLVDYRLTENTKKSKSNC